MNNKEYSHCSDTTETKRVLQVDYPIESSSLVVPIPIKENGDLNLLQNDGFELFDTSNDFIQNHIVVNNADQNLFTNNDSGLIGRSDDMSFTKMDEEILQAEQSNFLHEPTLAELNAYGGDNLLDNFNFDDLLLPPDSEMFEIPETFMNSYLMDHDVVDTGPVNRPSSSKSGFQHSITLQELLKKETKSQKSLSPPIVGTSVPGSGFMLASKSRENLSSSAPTHHGLDQTWQHIDPRQHLLATGSLAEAGATSSLSTGGVLTPGAYDLSCDKTIGDSEKNTKQEETFSSNIDSEASGCRKTSAESSSHKDNIFWQYNAYSKIPKGQKSVLKCNLKDSHCLKKVIDPVFSPNCPIKGIKHSGNPRMGEGNNLTPNPKLLQSIGSELDKWNKIITEMTPVSELPCDVRENTRKEKSKLVSRACRLRIKAQHEANKIKLYGLRTEHRRLSNAIAQMKKLFLKKKHGWSNASEKIIKDATRLKVAGKTTQFVNEVLEKTKLGVRRGGLDAL